MRGRPTRRGAGTPGVRLPSLAVNRTIITLAIVGALLLAACGTDADATTTSTTSIATTTAPAATTEVPIEVVPQTYEEFREQPTACSGEAPAPVVPMEFAEPEDMGLDPALKVPATIVTSCGSIEVELDPSVAPETVNSFVFLAEEGYFDGTVSHRILPGFVMQAGDQTATGIGGPGYTIADELPPQDFVHTRGTLAMANAGPGTTGSQFFIVLVDVQLHPQFSVFGEVVAGFEVLDRIEEIPLGRAPSSVDPSPSTPLETLYLDTVSIAG
jgi:peptidyl-prolyl cis-trans isomerase B (cyclophilin B)